jgi:isopentenyl-diphosphate Delta-isomerase
MSLIPIVDEDDHIIEYVERSERKPDQRYRVAALWITNSRGDILIAQRHRSKKHHPLLWWPAVAGTVEKDESYLENIIRETTEEIGISWITPTLGPKTQTTSGYLHFTQWFTVIFDKKIEEFSPARDEVESLRWISPEALKKEFTKFPENFVPSFSIILPLFL